MWAGIAIGFILGFFMGAVLMGLAAAGPPTPPDEEERSIRKQMEEKRRKHDKGISAGELRKDSPG